MMPAPGRRVTARTSAPADAARSAQAAEHLWTRPPQAPTRYSLRTRLADMAHGWADGKRGLPSLPEIPPAGPVNGAASQTPNGHFDAARLEPFQNRVAGSDGPTAPAAARATTATDQAAAMPPGWLQTPRMQMLCSRALELISAEEQACIGTAPCTKGSSRIPQCQGRRRREFLAAGRDLRGRSGRSARRSCHQAAGGAGARDRPEASCGNAGKPNGNAGWRRRRSPSVARRLAEATRDAELREELIRDRVAAARAAALRHHEFHMRRIATYLQQLVRTHKRGDELNMLIMRYPVGPDLPEWTRAPTGARPSTGPSSLGAGSASAEQNGAGEPHPTAK